MTDETKTEDTGTASTATEAPATPAAEQAPKLTQQVDIIDVGPCRKHIKVTIERKDIDARVQEKIKDLVHDANVAGFRPGKAPRKIVEKRYHKEVGEQIKNEVLLASLEQLADEHDIAPLAPPNINPTDIELPDEGPLVYEFEVEVRPQFELPNYKGLKLKRPVHTYTDAEVDDEMRRLLTPYGQIVPKPSGDAQLGDVVVAELTIKDGDTVVKSLPETQFQVEKQLAFRDAVAPNFAEQIKGARAGQAREADITLSSALTDTNLAGKTVKGVFAVKDVKTVRAPELTHEFLHNFGVHNVEQLRELVSGALQRRLEYQQRQAARRQVLEYIAATATWELPNDLLARQARKSLQRRVMEMQADGISEQEISSRLRLLQQDVLQSTALALKEHFVLQKIAEVEKIDVSEADLEDEIERLANQNDESPRRLRARLEKEDTLDVLAAEMIEREALNRILESAEWEEVPLKEAEEPSVAAVDAQATSSEMQDLTAPPLEQAPIEGGEPAAQ
jgi:trigger factor